MTRRRRLHLLLALVLALGTRLVYAVPVQAEAELRAVSHCTQHTGRPSSVPDARRCCQVSSEADTPATMAASIPLPASHPTVLPAVPATAAVPHSLLAPRLAAMTSRHGPPRYLALLAIRC